MKTAIVGSTGKVHEGREDRPKVGDLFRSKKHGVTKKLVEVYRTRVSNPRLDAMMRTSGSYVSTTRTQRRGGMLGSKTFKGGEIIFRWINGRVVPIRVKV